MSVMCATAYFVKFYTKGESCKKVINQNEVGAISTQSGMYGPSRCIGDGSAVISSSL